MPRKAKHTFESLILCVMDHLDIKRNLTAEWGKPKLEITYKNPLWCENFFSTLYCIGWTGLSWFYVRYE